MTAATANIALEVITERRARLDVVRTDTFGVTRHADGQVYQLGLHTAPLYQLVQPLSPDDRWVIEPKSSGALLPQAPSADSSSTRELSDYARWAAGSRAEHAQALLHALPAGSYWLLRCARPTQVVPQMLMGNELVAATPNIQLLRDEPPVYSCVIGPHLALAPDLNQPLLAVVILNYVGASWLHCACFFQFVSPEPAAGGAQRDAVLILPREGELVIDNLGFFSAENELESRRRWREDLAVEFALWCSGEQRDA